MTRNAEAPCLIVLLGDREGEIIPILSPRMVIGRDETADLTIDSARVSRQHAEIVYNQGQWFLTDLNSKNGVFLNGHRLEPHASVRFVNGDTIQLSRVVVFKFEDYNTTLPDTFQQVLNFGLWLDEDNHAVYVQNQLIAPPLSNNQFILLALLFSTPGKLISNDAIANTIWPEAEGGVTDQAIDNTVSRLNKQLRKFDPSHEYVVTVRGVGRKFVQKKT